MIVQAYIGRSSRGRAMVHVLDWPGLVSAEDSRDAALGGLPLALSRYAGWCGFHRGEGPDVRGAVQITLAGEVEVPGGFEAGDPFPIFGPDLASLDEPTRERCLERMGWVAEDLLELAEGLEPAKLAWVPPGRARSLEGELRQVARAWWDGLAPLRPGAEAPASAGRAPELAFHEPRPVAEALRDFHGRFAAGLRALPTELLSAEVPPDGSDPTRWTARKAARRAVEVALEHLFLMYRQLSAGKETV